MEDRGIKRGYREVRTLQRIFSGGVTQLNATTLWDCREAETEVRRQCVNVRWTICNYTKTLQLDRNNAVYLCKQSACSTCFLVLILLWLLNVQTKLRAGFVHRLTEVHGVIHTAGSHYIIMLFHWVWCSGTQLWEQSGGRRFGEDGWSNERHWWSSQLSGKQIKTQLVTSRSP